MNEKGEPTGDGEWEWTLDSGNKRKSGKERDRVEVGGSGGIRGGKRRDPISRVERTGNGRGRERK